MSLQIVHLRKLIKVLYAHHAARVSAIRSDIREEIAKADGLISGGGDFYGPFWADAKDHAIGVSDLYDTTEARIEANAARLSLYPQLRDGFLVWWNERRRWTNAPFQPLTSIKGRYRVSGLDATIKVENLLSIRDASGDDHFVYPYFSPEPSLNNEAARVALWVMGRSLPAQNWDELRLLDVIRGQPFSVDRLPLEGNEEGIFLRRYQEVLDQWQELKKEYS